MALYLDHVNALLQNLREAPITALSTDTSSVAFRAQGAVKNAVKRVWNAKQWTFKQRRTTQATVASTIRYNLPKYVGEPYKFLSSASPYDIDVISEDNFDKHIPNPTSEGNPIYAMLYEMTGVNTQPSSASALAIVSSSTADTTQTVLVKGTVSSDIDYEEITLSGTTSVSTTKSFSAIHSITKSDVTTGRITITSNSAAVTNLVLAPQEKTWRYRAYRLYPIPSSVLTITIKHFAIPPPMTRAFEDTEIPERWDYVVNQYAHAFALQPKGQDQLAEFQANIQVADKFVNEDMANEEDISSEKIIIPLRFGDVGTNFLTSWVPSGFGVTLGSFY